MKTILIVDDNENILQVLKELLEGKGFEVTTMERGAAVLEAVQLSKPDVVLMDITLGNSNGYDIYKAIKENIATRGTPVLLMSSGDGIASVAISNLKWEEVIDKPFDLKQLIGKMHWLAA
jgi:DNA-binding response OmpR family regulator